MSFLINHLSHQQLQMEKKHTLSDNEEDLSIALFTVTFSHLHYSDFEHGCEAISGNFALFARNCLTFTFNYIVMQMRKVNCEKGYCVD